MKTDSPEVFREPADAISLLGEAISCRVEGVSVLGVKITETVAWIRSPGRLIRVLGAAINSRVEGVSIAGTTIRETVARIRSLGTLIRERCRHVRHFR